MKIPRTRVFAETPTTQVWEFDKTNNNPAAGWGRQKTVSSMTRRTGYSITGWWSWSLKRWLGVSPPQSLFKVLCKAVNKYCLKIFLYHYCALFTLVYTCRWPAAFGSTSPHISHLYLYELVGPQVHGGGGLVPHQQRRLPQNSSYHTPHHNQ